MTNKLRVLDLFSGIGGFSLGLERTGGFETVAFCEIEKYPRKILAKHWPDVPIYTDVTKLYRFADDMIECPDGCDEPFCDLCNKHFFECDCVGCSEFEDEVGTIDVITGGFPCQDISVAGKQAGIKASRSGLWTEITRLISELQPKYAIVENVTALLSGDDGRWFQRILGDLAAIRYDCEWHCIPASELGAHHHRDRVWIVAYPEHHGRTTAAVSGSDEKNVRRTKKGANGTVQSAGVCTTYNVADAQGERIQGHGTSGQQESHPHARPILSMRHRERLDLADWETEPELGRVVDGLPNRVDRIKAIGNAVVPQIAELIGYAILENINNDIDG